MRDDNFDAFYNPEMDYTPLHATILESGREGLVDRGDLFGLSIKEDLETGSESTHDDTELTLARELAKGNLGAIDALRDMVVEGWVQQDNL